MPMPNARRPQPFRPLRVVLFAVTAWAVIEQLRRPPAERTWRGTLLGFVPYDFRLPTLARLKEAFWNPADHRLLTPRPLGIGWAVNFYELWRRVGTGFLPPPPAAPVPGVPPAPAPAPTAPVAA